MPILQKRPNIGQNISVYLYKLLPQWGHCSPLANHLLSITFFFSPFLTFTWFRVLYGSPTYSVWEGGCTLLKHKKKKLAMSTRSIVKILSILNANRLHTTYHQNRWYFGMIKGLQYALVCHKTTLFYKITYSSTEAGRGLMMIRGKVWGGNPPHFSTSQLPWQCSHGARLPATESHHH